MLCLTQDRVASPQDFGINLLVAVLPRERDDLAGRSEEVMLTRCPPEHANDQPVSGPRQNLFSDPPRCSPVYVVTHEISRGDFRSTASWQRRDTRQECV